MPWAVTLGKYLCLSVPTYKMEMMMAIIIYNLVKVDYMVVTNSTMHEPDIKDTYFSFT